MFWETWILIFWASLVAQLVKNLPAMRETWVWSLDWEDPLEKGKDSHSSILAWRILWTEGSQSWTRLNNFNFNMGLIYLYMLCGMGDLSSPTRDGTWALAEKAPNTNHWPTREFHENYFLSLWKYLNFHLLNNISIWSSLPVLSISFS